MISVRLDKSLEERLNLFSQEKHISKSRIIKDSLKFYFEKVEQEAKQKTPYELGKELFGKYASGETELSTTYKQKLKEKINAKNAH
jgi:predicted DNA-binding protein